MIKNNKFWNFLFGRMKNKNIKYQNKLSITIDKPIEEVFSYTTNPKKTCLWVPSVTEEFAQEYPKINTQYKNRGGNSNWNFYVVTEFDKDKRFTLTSLEGNYSCRYSYHKLSDNQTKLEYFEWARKGGLNNPFSEDNLQRLKYVIEHNR